MRGQCGGAQNFCREVSLSSPFFSSEKTFSPYVNSSLPLAQPLCLIRPACRSRCQQGPGSFLASYGATLDYLTDVVGSTFSPPVRFQAKVVTPNNFEMVKGESDFAIVDGALAACTLRESSGTVSAILTQATEQSGAFPGSGFWAPKS